ncbi:MAG: response regulator [Synechococcales cyanobacterium RM1_1_8]|nr:response regulator [Synechococcales cyanobacterium RM1_1_8]
MAVAPAHGADLLILDFEMPGINGLELCQVVRQDPRWSGLPILFWSVHQDGPLLEQLFAAGATDFLRKSATVEVLVERVERCLERSHPPLSPSAPLLHAAPSFPAPSFPAPSCPVPAACRKFPHPKSDSAANAAIHSRAIHSRQECHGSVPEKSTTG